MRGHLLQVENVVVVATGMSASIEDPCAVVHTGRLELSNCRPPSAAARTQMLQRLLVRPSNLIYPAESYSLRTSRSQQRPTPLHHQMCLPLHSP